ncbi:MAG: phosphatase PAP2 family protein [Oligoflexia bacterium]|nr:phosphatase PAP2 family protein [Oligoflexia bacterium]
MTIRFSLLIILLLINVSTLNAAPLHKHASRTFSDAFDKTGLIILSVGALGTIIAAGQDQAMHDTWVNNRPGEHQRMSTTLTNFGNFWGMGISEAGIAAGQLIFDRENGIASTEGLLSATVVAYTLKYSVRRARPDSNTLTSFPSGHSQVSFASATTIAMSYGWKYSVPSYILATVTAMSRLADNAHWFSDVVAGATIGILFGRAGFEHHFGVTPLTYNDGSRGYGLAFNWAY